MVCKHYHKLKDIIITILLLPLGHISNRDEGTTTCYRETSVTKRESNCTCLVIRLGSTTQTYSLMLVYIHLLHNCCYRGCGNNGWTKRLWSPLALEAIVFTDVLLTNLLSLFYSLHICTSFIYVCIAA